MTIIGQLLSQSASNAGQADRGQSVILSHQKSYERLIDEEKLEVKARSLLRAEKRQKLLVGHVPVPDPATYNHEKRLRKIATKGVVQLFNAIRKQQKEDLAVDSGSASAPSSEQRASSFLEKVKAAATKMAQTEAEESDDD